MMLSKRCIPICEALAAVKQWHRHLPKCDHRMWAVGAFVGESLVGVAIVAKPCRALDDKRTLEVVRLATDGTANVCSLLYGACAQAAKAMGMKLTTCTREDEPGASLRAAGWVLEEKLTRPHQWSCQSRQRREVELIPKRRWWAPHSLRCT